MREHQYELTVTWTGNQGTGTSDYRSYRRTHEVTAPGLPTLPGSSDPTFRGERDRWNPEQLLLAAVSQCHLLSYLHLCAVNGVVVTGYTDQPHGTMTEASGGGRFTAITLHPQVTVAEPDMIARAVALHADANRACFIANSLNLPVHHEPNVSTGND